MPTATVNSIDLAYDESGAGSPLVFVHGLGSCGLDWEAQAAAFRDRYRVITPDLRGHGRSGQPPGPYTIPLFAADVVGLLDVLRIEKAHVVGLSLGGAVAFQLALDAPARVASLTIVNSGPELILRTLRDRIRIGMRLAIVHVFGLARLGRMLGRRLLPDPEHADRRAAFERRFAQTRKRPYLDSVRALVGWSVTPRLGEIRCPTLVVASDQDYTPVAVKEAYVARLPNAQLVVVPDSRHALPVERPEAFNRLLADFLDAAAASPRA